MNVILIVLDGVGVGELDDACKFGDIGSNTLGNLSKKVFLKIPNLLKLGISNIIDLNNLPPVEMPAAAYGKMAEVSEGKDTITGHWEISGIISSEAFPTYPDGFPPEVIEPFEHKIERQIIGNKPASGTQIIEELGDEHLKTGRPIVYTSADSVFQIATHEEVIPLDKLYKWCQIARNILKGNHRVARVIARPFEGTSGNYRRTVNRRDFSVKPPGETMLNRLENNNIIVIAIGKVSDIFADDGISEVVKCTGNKNIMDETIKLIRDKQIKINDDRFIISNLVDFDMLYGHRNDTNGFANALKEFDNQLDEVLNSLSDDDILIITADHGCDPTTASTDHSREYVPVLIYGKKIKPSNIGTRHSFADLGETILSLFELKNIGTGKSFANLIT